MDTLDSSHGVIAGIPRFWGNTSPTLVATTAPVDPALQEQQPISNVNLHVDANGPERKYRSKV